MDVNQYERESVNKMIVNKNLVLWQNCSQRYEKFEEQNRYDLMKGKFLKTNEELLVIDVKMFPYPSGVNHCIKTRMIFLA